MSNFEFVPPIRRAGRIRAHLRLMKTLLAANLGAAMEYRGNFLLQVFGMAINNAAFVIFWKFLLERTGGLGGYQFADVMFLWALGSASFGLAHIVFGNVRGLSELIRSGDLDVYLLQPKDVLLNAAASKTLVSGWGDLLYGIIVIILLTPDPLRLGIFVVAVLAGALIFSAVFALAESLAFWTGSSAGISQVVLEFMLSFSLYPEKIFPEAIRWLLYSLIPSGFIVFLPLQAFRSPDPLILAVVALAGIAYPILAWLSFRAGLKRYESGNRVGARS